MEFCLCEVYLPISPCCFSKNWYTVDSLSHAHSQKGMANAFWTRQIHPIFYPQTCAVQFWCFYLGAGDIYPQNSLCSFWSLKCRQPPGTGPA
uniref:Uncharacterized protein LOC105129939 isoform X1 n=1 Tax=Rhizophora mucronata TaxID=61149 RepID=A0A2P2K2T4_RHIMU